MVEIGRDGGEAVEDEDGGFDGLGWRDVDVVVGVVSWDGEFEGWEGAWGVWLGCIVYLRHYVGLFVYFSDSEVGSSL